MLTRGHRSAPARPSPEFSYEAGPFTDRIRGTRCSRRGGADSRPTCSTVSSGATSVRSAPAASPPSPARSASRARSTSACPPAACGRPPAPARPGSRSSTRSRTSSSIGAVEVAPSNPNIIYVGTGDMITGGGINEGNGVYKSHRRRAHVDAHRARADEADPVILVDPRDREHRARRRAGRRPRRRARDRGVFRSDRRRRTVGRARSSSTTRPASQKLASAFDRPDVVFATTVRHYTPPAAAERRQLGGGGGPRRPQRGPTGTAIYKSLGRRRHLEGDHRRRAAARSTAARRSPSR